MRGCLKAGIERQLPLSSSIREMLEALLEIGVVIGKPGSRGDRNHHPAQVGPLEQSGRTPVRQTIEIQQAGAASSTQHAPELPEPGCGIHQIAQPIGHQRPIGTGILQLEIQDIALSPLHWQPGPLLRALGSNHQRLSSRIDTNHSTTGAQMARQGQSQITGSAAEIKPLLPGLRRQLQNQLSLPLAMEPEAEPVVQPVVTRCSIVEQLFNGCRITGLQSGRSLSVITITVAIPTAAEHTMQPASISENSP